MGALSALRRTIAIYLANDDPLAAAANSGAFLVWSSQPLYPLYVELLVGHDAWPALLTWLSTPAFAAVPIIARRSSAAGRTGFVLAGLANTLVSQAAFGPQAGIAWFLVPCAILATVFVRRVEWPIALGLCALVALAALAIPPLGPGLVDYSPEQSTALRHLNAGSAGGLSLYLLIAGIRAHRASGAAVARS